CAARTGIKANREPGSRSRAGTSWPPRTAPTWGQERIANEFRSARKPPGLHACTQVRVGETQRRIQHVPARMCTHLHVPASRVARGVQLAVENLWTGRRIGGANIERRGEEVPARA